MTMPTVRRSLVTLAGDHTCTECGLPIPRARRGQYQHDGQCRAKAIRTVTRIVGHDLAKRIYGEDLGMLKDLPEMEPMRSRQRRKACLNATVAGNAITDTGESR